MKSRLLGITGGICSGKTTIAGFFRDMGATVLDADKIVHRLYEKDRKIKKDVLRKFGNGVFTGKKIDRKRLAAEVFGSEQKLRELCGIIYPAAIKKIKEESRKRKAAVVVIDAPLLIEAGLLDLVDYALVVRANLKKRAQRASKRGLSRRDFLARHRLQMPFTEKKKYADFIINNNRSKRDVKKETRRIWELLKKKQS